jgi:hypothetical protein
MKLVRTLSLSLIAVALGGCSIVTEFSKTGDSEYSPLASDCAVSVYTTSPQKNFDELGMVDLVGCPFFVGCTSLRTASKVKEVFSKHVCEAGGNGLLLWEANGHGIYTKGTVIRTK